MRTVLATILGRFARDAWTFADVLCGMMICRTWLTEPREPIGWGEAVWFALMGAIAGGVAALLRPEEPRG